MYVYMCVCVGGLPHTHTHTDYYELGPDEQRRRRLRAGLEAEVVQTALPWRVDMVEYPFRDADDHTLTLSCEASGICCDGTLGYFTRAEGKNPHACTVRVARVRVRTRESTHAHTHAHTCTHLIPPYTQTQRRSFRSS